MPSLLQFGVEQGSNVVGAQRGIYVCEFDIATGSATNFSFTYDTGDEILDLGTPDTPLAPAGAYVVSATVFWNEEEAGAFAEIFFQVGGTPANQVIELGLSRPGGTAGTATAAGTDLLADDFTSSIYGGLRHDRAIDNLTGEVVMSVLRIY